MRLAPVPTFLVAVAAVSLAQESAREGPPPPSFESRVDLVTVDVVVLDPKGQPVRDLRREDFTLFEDGRPQEIASFEPFLGETGEGSVPSSSAAAPAESVVRPSRFGARTFVLLVDDMSLAPYRQEEVRKALIRFVDEGLAKGDELIFATTSGDAWWSARMPEGRYDLLAVFGRIRGRKLSADTRDAVSEWEAFRIVHFEGAGGRASINSDGAPAATGPPTGSVRPASLPGIDLTDRVVMRYYDRRVCSPEQPGATPREQCAAMARRNAQVVDQRRTNRTRDVLAAVDRAVFALTGVRGRKALLLLTEGFLNDPDLRGMQEVASRCREANLAVHSLDVRGLLASAPGLSASDWGSANVAEMGLMRMEQIEAQAGGNVGLAEDTGGFAIRDTNDLGAGAVQVANESRVYYLLGFAPPDGKGARDWRKLRVTVKRPGVTVRARKGYTLRSSAEIAGGSGAVTDQRPPDVTRALLSPHERPDIPLRSRAHVFGDLSGGKVSVVVAVEADLSRLANLGGDRPRSALSLSIAATHRDTGAVTRVDQHVTVEAGLGSAWEGWLALQRELELPPGVSQARVVVRDEFLGRVGATTIRFEVPPFGGWRLATPVLTDRLRPGAKGTSPTPVLLARREFAPTGQLYCYFQVLGTRAGAGQVSAVESRFLVRHAGGGTVTEGTPASLSVGADGRLVGLLGVLLHGWPTGPYELVLRVEDRASGRVLEQTEAFRVGAGS